MRRHLQFALGVTLIAAPMAVLIGFVVYQYLQLRAELEFYRYWFVTINIDLDVIVSAFVLLVIAVASSIAGMNLIDRSRYGDASKPLSIFQP